MKNFEHCYCIPPIDDFEGIVVAGGISARNVLFDMPEKPRDGVVYEIPIIPDNGHWQFYTAYICKADNNGTMYIFSHCDLSYIPNIEVVW